MPKAILFDADGVTIKRQTEFFSERFIREYGAPVDEVKNFFKADFRGCQLGELNLKEALAPKLAGWNWPGDADSFLNYWFETTLPDEEVLAEVQTFRQKGVECYLATDQDRYRAQYITKDLAFATKFDGFFFSYDLRISKSEPEFFTEILRRLDQSIKAHEIDYWDDDMENVDAAKSVGINSRFWHSLEDFKKNYAH